MGFIDKADRSRLRDAGASRLRAKKHRPKMLLKRTSRRGTGQPASPTTLTPPGSPLYWFDFTDTTTTFQNTAGTTPATANGHVVARINNKGSASDFLSQGTGGKEPTLSNHYFGSLGLLLAVFDGGDFVSATIANGLGEDAGGYSFAYVAAHSAGTSGDVPFSWESSLGLRASGGAGEIVIMTTGASGNVTVGTATADVLLSGLWVERTNDTQQMYCNLDASIFEQSNTSNGPADAKDLVIGGTSTAVPSMIGYVGELIIWPTELTAGLVTDWQTYTNSKYGITWA